MKRRKFIKQCCVGTGSIALLGLVLPSCGTIYYAKHTVDNNLIVVNASEFKDSSKEKSKQRKFVLLKVSQYSFPICVYQLGEDNYQAALLKCTHRGCELNVGGGIYTCPCHGSEFSVSGDVLEGPAEQKLQMFDLTIDNEKLYIQLI
jgi:cytochrome b6-f complex iron-sulfur subunit